MSTATAHRASLFLSHKVSLHGALANRLKSLLEARAERLDVHVCEEIMAGEDWHAWIESTVAGSKSLLVLWPPGDVSVARIAEEIALFRAKCRDGRIVVLHAPGAPPPASVEQLQTIAVAATDITKHFLLPLFSNASFLNVDSPLNARVQSEDVLPDAREIERLYFGIGNEETKSYVERLTVERPSSDANWLQLATVYAPHGCKTILAWNARNFTWAELRARAQRDTGRGTFWVTEMELAMQSVIDHGEARVMTSTFRGQGETAGRIYQPQLLEVEPADGPPIRFHFSFHEALVPELVRGPDDIGEIFNALHIALRVRWEVLEPFLLKLQSDETRQPISEEKRNDIIARVSGSLRAIELEADRHEMLDEKMAQAFDGPDRANVLRMLAQRERVHTAIIEATQRKDYEDLMRELTAGLQFNVEATALLAHRFVQLLQKDHRRLRRSKKSRADAGHLSAREDESRSSELIQ